jgi:hypothetical protein
VIRAIAAYALVTVGAPLIALGCVLFRLADRIDGRPRRTVPVDWRT